MSCSSIHSGESCKVVIMLSLIVSRWHLPLNPGGTLAAFSNPLDQSQQFVISLSRRRS